MTFENSERIAPVHAKTDRNPAGTRLDLRSAGPNGDEEQLLKRLDAYLDTSSNAKKSPLTASELMALATGGPTVQAASLP